jgi:putative FmdB family regulatory protein
MPVYEYECSHCGQSFERLQSVGGRAPRACPYCEKTGTVRRRVSAPAFQFKGTGWYVTDYADKGKGQGKKSSDSDAGSDDAPAKSDKGDKGDDKPAKTDDKKADAKKAKASTKSDD